jgi:hypothetical protein
MLTSCCIAAIKIKKCLFEVPVRKEKQREAKKRHWKKQQGLKFATGASQVGASLPVFTLV